MRKNITTTRKKHLRSLGARADTTSKPLENQEKWVYTNGSQEVFTITPKNTTSQDWTFSLPRII